MKTGHRDDNVKVRKTNNICKKHQPDKINPETFKHLLTDRETSTVLTNKYEAKPDLQESLDIFYDRNRKPDPDYFRKAQSFKISIRK